MYTVSCKKIGIDDCDFVATGNTRHHTKTLQLDHINYEHHSVLCDKDREWLSTFEDMVDVHISEADAASSGATAEAQPYTVSCRQVGFPDCDFVASGKTRHHTMLVELEHVNYEHHSFYAGKTPEWRNEFEQKVAVNISGPEA